VRTCSKKTHNASRDQNKTEQCEGNPQKKASHQQCRSGISTSPTPCCESLRQQHPNNSKQHGALAKIGNLLFCSRLGWKPSISNRVPRDPALAKALLFVKAAPILAKRVTAAISFSGP
jgi:hypothetical protein